MTNRIRLFPRSLSSFSRLASRLPAPLRTALLGIILLGITLLGTLLSGALLLSAAFAQTLGNNHVTGAYPGTAAFDQDPDYLAPAGSDGTSGTLDDEHIPQNAYRAETGPGGSYLGGETNLYGEPLDGDDPAMGAAGAIGTPLPVELAEATVQTVSGPGESRSGKSSARAEIRFRVLSETNNAGFTVKAKAHAESATGAEASEEPSSEAPWTVIAEIQGRGTTGEPATYSVTDRELAVRPPMLRYRIVQTDLDGTQEVVAELEAENPYRPEGGLRTWPNPTSGVVTLDVAPEGAMTSGTERAEVALYDVLGRRVQATEVPLQGGRAQTVWTLDVAPGTYFLRITPKTGPPVTRRVTVVR